MRYNQTATYVLFTRRIAMNKTELVAAIAKETGLSKKATEDTLKAFIDVTGKELLLRLL